MGKRRFKRKKEVEDWNGFWMEGLKYKIVGDKLIQIPGEKKRSGSMRMSGGILYKPWKKASDYNYSEYIK